jgi:outer membrane cobalamin receptor
MKKRIYYLNALCFSLGIILGKTAIAVEEDRKERLTKLASLSLDELVEVYITTASKSSEKLHDTPATVIVINREQIEKRRYISLIDLLRDLPGVDVQRGSRATYFNDVTFRGHAGTNKFIILQDGVRMSSPTGENTPVAENLPLYHAKQVEIVYGSASALYGADAFGGVINIITEEADKIKGGKISAATGTNNYQYYYAHGGETFSNGKVALTGGAHIHQHDRANLAKYYPASFPKVDAIASDGKVAIPASQREDYVGDIESQSAFLKLNIDKHLTFGANHSFVNYLSSTGDRPQSAVYDANHRYKIRLNNLYAKYNAEVAPTISSETTLNYSTFELLPDSTFQNIYSNWQDSYSYNKGKKAGIEQQITWKIDKDQAVIGGVSYDSFDSLPVTNVYQHPLIRGVSLEQQGLYYLGTDNTLPVKFIESKYNNAAAYLQWQSNWSKQFSSLIGLRYDKHSEYGSSVNPRLGLVYHIDDKTIFKTMYGEGFRSPSSEERLNHYGTFSGQKNQNGDYISNVFRVANPSLQPEKSRSLEVSLIQSLQDNLTLTTSGYYTIIDKVIMVRNVTNPPQFLVGGFITAGNMNDNVGKAKQYGLDISMDYKQNFGNDLKGNFWGTYSFIDGKIQPPSGIDSDLVYVARNKVKLGATLSYHDFFVTPSFYLIGKTTNPRTETTNPAQRLQSAGYALMDLHLGYRNLWGKLSANLDIYNVFDTRYYNSGGPTFASFVGMPQQPRTLMFSLTHDF